MIRTQEIELGSRHALGDSMISSKTQDRIVRYCTWLVVLLLSAGLYSYLLRAHAAVGSDLELDYGEGTVYWQVESLPHLATAVHPLNTYPYILFNYTPVYHCATWLVGQFTPTMLGAGRLVSVLSMLGICLLAGVIVWQATTGWARLPCSLMAGLLLLHLPNTDWSLLMRVDIIGIFFLYAGLCLFLMARRFPALTYAAFGCFVLAIYSKQTLIAAPAACLACLFIENFKRGLKVLIAFAFTGFAILAGLAWLTHGEIVRHFFKYNVSPFAWGRGMWLAYSLAHDSVLIIVMALGAVFGVILLLNSSRRRTGSLVGSLRKMMVEDNAQRTALVFSVYLGISCVTSLSIAKVGANVNYLLEPLFATCVLAALFIAARLSAERNSRFALAGPLIVLTAAAVVAVTTAGLTPRSAGDLAFEEQHEAAHTQMLLWLSGMPGPVYSEEMTLLLEAQKEVPAEPASVTFLSAMHLWNEAPLVQRFDDQRFSAVIVNTNINDKEHFSPGVRKAILANYELNKQVGPYTIYLPVKAESNATPAK